MHEHVKVKRVADRNASVADRMAFGRAIRQEVPRTSLAQFGPTGDRDPVAMLQAQNATRVPELIGIRHARMAVSPFTFYRGAAAIMAHDLASAPRSDINVQLCGDAHLSNFGIFASPERRLVFDINDFDETNPGPFEWDLKRLAASMAIASAQQGFDERQQEAAVVAAVNGYRDAMASFAEMNHLDVWYLHFDIDSIAKAIDPFLSKDDRKRMTGALNRARQKNSEKAFRKMTHVVDGQLRILSDPPLLVPFDEIDGGHFDAQATRTQLEEILRRFGDTLVSDRAYLLSQYRLVDLARKVVGVGSVGTRCFAVLLEGSDDEDPLFLQVKQAEKSVLEAYVGESKYEQSGERVVAGQRLMQATPDIFLGWQRIEGLDGVHRDFYIRQLYDQKGSIIIENLTPTTMAVYGSLCGRTLARAHARSGDRTVLAGYLGKSNVFADSMAAFAFSYAEQNKRDHAALCAAIKNGKIPYTPDPKQSGAGLIGA